MDLRKIEYFEAVSRLKSFTKAAKELHIAQPSITASIIKLEEELGVPLLYRTKNSVSLTKEGELFLGRARYILDEVQNVEKEVRDLGVKSSRTLKVAIPPSLGAWMFPVIFLDYAVKNPDIILEIRDLGIQSILDCINNESIELGFVVLSEASSAYNSIPFSKENLYVLLPKEHPYANCKKIPFKELRNEKFILCTTASFTIKKVMEECQRNNFKPNVIFTPDHVVTVFNLISSGIGISFVLSDYIAIIKDNPSIVIKPLEDAIEFQTGFIWAENRYLSKVSRNFIDFMQQTKGR